MPLTLAPFLLPLLSSSAASRPGGSSRQGARSVNRSSTPHGRAPRTGDLVDGLWAVGVGDEQGIGGVVDDDAAILLGKGHELLELAPCRSGTRGVVGRAEEDDVGTGDLSRCRGKEGFGAGQRRENGLAWSGPENCNSRLLEVRAAPRNTPSHRGQIWEEVILWAARHVGDAIVVCAVELASHAHDDRGIHIHGVRRVLQGAAAKRAPRCRGMAQRCGA